VADEARLDHVLIFSFAAPHTGHGSHRNINKLVWMVSHLTILRKYLRKFNPKMPSISPSE
jgi:hypothetical protein